MHCLQALAQLPRQLGDLNELVDAIAATAALRIERPVQQLREAVAGGGGADSWRGGTTSISSGGHRLPVSVPLYQ